MDSDKDDVLSLNDEPNRESSDEFSGFSPLRDTSPKLSNSKKKGNSKSAASKGKALKKKTSKTSNKENRNVPASGAGQSSRGQKKDSDRNPLLDISKLTEQEINQLREKLGIVLPHQQYADAEDIQSIFGDSLENLPSLRVEFDPTELSDGENPQNRQNNKRQISSELHDALFEAEEGEIVDEWELPRLKAPEKGIPVSETLAKKVNLACTSQCDVDSLVIKYKIPQNCDRACPPLVNNEVWKIMNKQAQSNDRSIQDIQNLVATGITPIIKLAEVLKPQIRTNAEAKTLLSDSLTLLGQVQFQLSVRRRYFIRPNLRKKYSGLCNISTPISDKLFGDDITKDIKSYDSLSGLGKDQNYFYPRPLRGAARGGYYPRRGYSAGYNYPQYGYGAGYSQNYGYGPNRRFHPYPPRGHYRQPTRARGAKKTATVTSASPNEQN